MEELRSTDILDREIQDDSRRKAEKVLKASEIECIQIERDVAARIETTKAQKVAEYNLRLEAYTRDVGSAIPLEKQRRLVSFIDLSVKESLELWFSGIGSAKRLSLFAAKLERYKSVLAGQTLSVSFVGYTAEEIHALVVSVFGKGTVADVTELTAARARAAGFSDGLRIESADRVILCRATLEEIREELLATKRQEMAEALLGGRLPE